MLEAKLDRAIIPKRLLDAIKELVTDTNFESTIFVTLKTGDDADVLNLTDKAKTEFVGTVEDMTTLGEGVSIEVSQDGVQFVSSGEGANETAGTKVEDEEQGAQKKSMNHKKNKNANVKTEDVEMDGEDEDEEEVKARSNDVGEDEEGNKKRCQKAHTKQARSEEIEKSSDELESLNGGGPSG
ncbi:hypothetical protein FIBSPDRAFT_959738 [Athelia psychrophila]|uniref:Proliferating cell nuclear antigen PCNA N-terminal domain-containing protein n=1 Tax=Athelia psychrophila TaxID=1759441 RepID=A0A166D7R0_9AGAM|nr:hypothetical protein FIBSPDRAFT_959738 [Fibularhizoctonia sp. CBS 109695]